MKITLQYLIVFLFINPLWLTAQNRFSKQLAEPFSISVPVPQNTLLPEKGASFGPFEILSIQTNTGKDNTQLVQLQLVAYDTGLFRLSKVMPEIITDTSWLVKIVAPAENTIREYGQPKEISIQEEDRANRLPWWLILIAVAVLALALIYFLRQKKKTEPTQMVMSGEISLDILFKLKDQWGRQEITSIELGEELVQALHIHFGVSTKKTISALYKSITKQVPGLDKEDVKKYLRLSDAWRFGKQNASRETGKQTIEAIQKIIIEPNAGVKNHTDV